MKTFQVKAAFTRAYNKASVVTPYALVAPVKKGKGPKADGEEEGLEEEGEVDENEEQEEDNMDNDAMIMVRINYRFKREDDFGVCLRHPLALSSDSVTMVHHFPV